VAHVGSTRAGVEVGRFPEKGIVHHSDNTMRMSAQARRRRYARSVLILLMVFGVSAMVFGQSAASGLHPYSLQPATHQSVGDWSFDIHLVWMALLVVSHERDEAALFRFHSGASSAHRRIGYQIALISLPPPTRA